MGQVNFLKEHDFHSSIENALSNAQITPRMCPYAMKSPGGGGGGGEGKPLRIRYKLWKATPKGPCVNLWSRRGRRALPYIDSVVTTVTTG